MSFSMDAQNFQMHEVEDKFSPAPKGQYRCELDNCQLLDRVSKANFQLTDFKAQVTIFMPDSSTKKAWINMFVAHNGESAKGLAQKNQNALFELYLNVVSAKFGGDSNQFATISPESIHMMNGAIVELGLDVDKGNNQFNEVVVFNPKPIHAAAQQAPQQPAPQFQQQPAPQFQQQQAPVNNGFPVQNQAPMNNGQQSMPPFMQQQNTQG
jgi:hypothetical protein